MDAQVVLLSLSCEAVPALYRRRRRIPTCGAPGDHASPS